jgi:hypothetical protein
MAMSVIRYSERPELWEDTAAVSEAVWPEYNQHGEVLERYWGGLFDESPEFQFVLYGTTRTASRPKATPFPVLGMGRPKG